LKPTAADAWPASLSIVKSALSNFDYLLIVFSCDAIDEPVLFVDAPGPPAVQNRLERLRLPNPSESLFRNLIKDYRAFAA
jgi:hypothetical protein